MHTVGGVRKHHAALPVWPAALGVGRALVAHVRADALAALGHLKLDRRLVPSPRLITHPPARAALACKAHDAPADDRAGGSHRRLELRLTACLGLQGVAVARTGARRLACDGAALPRLHNCSCSLLLHLLGSFLWFSLLARKGGRAPAAIVLPPEPERLDQLRCAQLGRLGTLDGIMLRLCLLRLIAGSNILLQAGAPAGGRRGGFFRKTAAAAGRAQRAAACCLLLGLRIGFRRRPPPQRRLLLGFDGHRRLALLHLPSCLAAHLIHLLVALHRSGLLDGTNGALH